MSLDELKVYHVAMEIGEVVWGLVFKWDFFAKDTVGKQWVRAADSMAANLSEGYGRFFYKENKQFCYYSRGSLFETRTWLSKAFSRGLVDEQTHEDLQQKLEALSVKLNNYIRSIGRTTDRVKEDDLEWNLHDALPSHLTNDVSKASRNDAREASH